ncbi:hypothetical protein MFUM_190042 [Methylacidiphilum fumariolicum SolV]|uniref:Uncharacterized protein n=2 Tax=Candidatus Methylacidiphilum fumarolicum TaxID=591154 RepID=I0JWS4_METFB|nr:conserved protein of unknown function [Candidatus Methylacidiphilum fumarolicum]CCG91693.1 hypothetical protein MFUM_190042 [Methylacidiphilum fumariolicum SolV]
MLAEIERWLNKSLQQLLKLRSLSALVSEYLHIYGNAPSKELSWIII